MAKTAYATQCRVYAATLSTYLSIRRHVEGVDYFRCYFRFVLIIMFIEAAHHALCTATPCKEKVRRASKPLNVALPALDASFSQGRGLRRILHTARVMADQTHFRENLPSLTHS